jgi:signal transduction histidine kinase
MRSAIMPANETRADGPASEGSPLRILIVDDAPEDRELFRRLLSRNGQVRNELIEAETAADGLALCRQVMPDCLILDYRLPDLTGLEVLAELRGSGGYPVVPVIVLTGQGDEKVHQSAMQAGAQDYIVKDDVNAKHLWFSIRHAIDRHRLAAALQEALARAETASRARRDFIASASHDLRTPVHIMLGMLDMLLDTNLTAQQRDLAQRARGSAATLFSLSGDLLDFARIDAGKVDVDSHDFEVRRFFATTVDAFLLQAERKGVALSWEVAPEVPDTVVGVPGRLRQILTNLVGNALKFTEQGSVTVRCWVAKELADVLALHVEVSDTGIGLAPEMEGRLFEPFCQGDRQHYEGTGLGLAICKRLVDLMEGQIGVESARGQGSTFWFSLPMRQSPSRPR